MTQALREKANARRVLMILAGLLVMIMALQGLASVKPGGFEANAATTPSPTPTGTAIQLLNPSKKTSNELSDKDDGSATDKNTYHLVAWTHLAPSGAGVQFKYDPAGVDPEITIGNGTQVGTDTWELHWDIPDSVADAGAQAPGPTPRTSPTSGVLKAILFNSSGSEVARDEEDVSINNKDRPTSDSNNFLIENQAETVELSYPTNGGQMGFYGAQDGTYTGIVEVTYSNEAATVQAFYTVDPPGTDPNFVPCSTKEPVGTNAQVSNEPGTAEDGLRCTLASGDRPSQVTAIAAVVFDKSDEPIGQTQGEDKDSSDAHRVVAYEQDPSSVVITPSSDTEDVNKCTDPSFRAVVTDASGQQVAGANIDVHAQGPTDNLHFDDSSGAKSSTHQPPDGGTHAKESGVDCESTSAQPVFVADVQGDHENLTVPDIKHIESTIATSAAKTGGTDDSGSFTFALLSRDVGGTQITAFVDEDFNDRHCSEEAAGHASIGWGSAAPSPTGTAAEDTSCPKPTPGQTTTPTSSPTGTATTSPTSSPTSTGPSTNRTVTMAVDRAKVPAGRTVTFSGQILSQDQSCVDNEFVEIRRRVHGTTTSAPFETTATNSEGRFELRTRVKKSATYVAVAPAHDNCRASSSGEVSVLVKVVIQIAASDQTPQRGDRFRLKSSVRPQHDGTTLILQRKKGRRWVTVDKDKLNSRSIASFTVVANFDRRTFRTKWRSQDDEHETNTSPTVTIRSR